MKPVTVQEVIDALTDAIDLCLPDGGPYVLTTFEVLKCRIEDHGIAPPDGMMLIERDRLESYMQALYGASRGTQNFYANCADELRAMLAAAPKQENSKNGFSFLKNKDKP